jgi:hypothetical protein
VWLCLLFGTNEETGGLIFVSLGLKELYLGLKLLIFTS